MDEESLSALMMLTAIGLGLALFVATLILIRRKKGDSAIDRATKASQTVSLLVGVLSALLWVGLGNEPFLPVAPFSILFFYMAPAFLVMFYVSWFMFRRSSGENNA
ncbi:MAG: hypothetical protein AAGM16_13075 [Pseudomonadota bacterium]